MDENNNFIEGEKVEDANTTTSNETNTFNTASTKTNYRPVSEFTVKSKKKINLVLVEQLQFHLFLV